jgi:hypothetical protein
MKTSDFITMLATGAGAVDARAVADRYAIAVGWGALGALLLMAVMLGARHDLAQAAMHPMFWTKLGYVGWLAGAAFLALTRLARPGVRLGRIVLVVAAPVVLMWMLAAADLMSAQNSFDRKELLFGKTWTSCPWLIALLSVPVFAAMTWAVRRLAPTLLRLTGAALGFTSGAIGAVVYSMHCPEMTAPFLGLWYLVGLMIPTTVGALIGPRLLRW